MNQREQPANNHGRPLPPVATRWRKGQSGNPKGRPRKEDSIVGLLKELVSALCPTDTEKRSYADLLVRSLLHQGLKGNLGAIKEILNRLDGRVPFLIERVGTAPPPDQETCSESKSLTLAKRAELDLEVKNTIREIYGLTPLEEETGENDNACGTGS